MSSACLPILTLRESSSLDKCQEVPAAMNWGNLVGGVSDNKVNLSLGKALRYNKGIS